MRPHAEAGITITEVLVITVVVLVILFYFARPTVGTGLSKGQMTQTLSNAKQLLLATQQMALDGQTTGHTNLGWPGDSGGTYSNWVKQLVPDYLTTNDFCKLMSAPGIFQPPGKIPTKERCALLVYDVSRNSPSNTVFVSSANFTNTPTGGSPPTKNAKPYGDKGFVVFRKGGDGAILQARQAGKTELIGDFAPPLQ